MSSWLTRFTDFIAMVELKEPKAGVNDIQPASGVPHFESHAPPPAPYLRQLPEQSLVIPRDTRRVDESYPLTPNDNFVNGRGEHMGVCVSRSPIRVGS